MSFYGTKATEYRLCDTPGDRAALRHTFGRFSKYFQCDNYYANLETPVTSPAPGHTIGCGSVKLYGEVPSSSEAILNKVARTVLDRPHAGVCDRTNDASDRALGSIMTLNVPSHGSSTKRTLTAHRPGAQSAPGTGVDIKHGSYHRYGMRIRGQVLTSGGC